MKGTVVYIYAFDVANEIKTELVREVLSEKPFPFQIRVGATAPKDVPFYTPLTISLKPIECESNVGRILLAPYVKVFDVGVLSITYEVAFDRPSLRDLMPYHQLRIGDAPLTSFAEKLAAQVADSLKASMVKPIADHTPGEAYTVFCVSDAESPVTTWAEHHREEIAGLLSEEVAPQNLAEGQIQETMRHALSYTRDDFTVIDWDAALVVDRSGYYDDVLYVIELANLQLEEFRLLDDRLDRLFLNAYDDLERYASLRRILFSPEPRLRSIRQIRMDITKMSEELTNITKFVGDWYLARVYLACKDRFHLGTWEASVDQKLHELDRLYSMVHQEINEKRMLVLEATIVALFIFDVAALLLFKK